MIKHFKFFPVDSVPAPSAADFELLRVRVFDSLKTKDLALLLAKAFFDDKRKACRRKADELNNVLERGFLGLLPLHPQTGQVLSVEKAAWIEREVKMNLGLIAMYDAILKPGNAVKFAKIIDGDLDRERLWLWWYKVCGGKDHTDKELWNISGSDVTLKTF